MSFWGRITNPINHKQDLDKIAKEVEQKVKEYNEKWCELNHVTQRLYDVRKLAFKRLTALDSYVSNLRDCPNSLQLGTKRALEYAILFKKTWDAENIPNFENRRNSSIAGSVLAGTAVAGAATAMGGAASAMAIATTFGTAGTGAAISSLSGAAATNAALAWLGGGTVAAGGAGMSGGAALLGALGPIGWTVLGASGIALIVKSTFDKKKNDKKIEELKKLNEDFAFNIIKCKSGIRQIQHMINITQGKMNKIDVHRLGGTSSFKDENYPQALLFEMVSEAKNLGKYIRQIMH